MPLLRRAFADRNDIQQLTTNTMQSIQSKILLVTNHKPTRIKAFCARGSITIGWDSPRLGNGNQEEKHANAALLLLEKFSSEDNKTYGATNDHHWLHHKDSHLITGDLPNGDYVHIIVSNGSLKSERKNVFANTDKYSIVRMFARAHYSNKIIHKGLTLEEARTHCHDSETSSSTCTGKAGKAVTKRNGEWFDGYEKE